MVWMVAKQYGLLEQEILELSYSYDEHKCEKGES